MSFTKNNRIYMVVEFDQMNETCLYFVICNNIPYCLKFREWNEPCPSKCSYFFDTQKVSVIDDCFDVYNIECNNLSRKLDSNHDPILFCLFTLSTDPHCSSCSFCFSFLPSLSSFHSSNSHERSHNIVVTNRIRPS